MVGIKIWVDDVRPMPGSYNYHCYTVDDTIELIYAMEKAGHTIALIDLDHDAGEFEYAGGDYIRILDFLEDYGYEGAIRLHTMNPVGRQNMETIIEKNGWELIR